MRISAIIAAAAIATGASAVSAATIDFTDTAIWVDGSSTDTVLGSTVSLSATGGVITSTPFDGGAAIPGLASLGDGLGVGDDEISQGQSLTVTFDGPLRVLGFSFLDLFFADAVNFESVVVTFDGGLSLTFDAIAPLASAGFLSTTLGSAVTASSLTFTTGPGNDGRGLADFALAAIEVAPVPLPASALMFLSALLGLGFVARGRASA